MLRMAIVGVGWAGTRQVQAVRELGRKVEVTCLVDHDADFLAAKGQELCIRDCTTDYGKVLADPNVDAVSICTPHALHCEMAIEAASAGKHVLVEKPMAMTVAEATRMIEAARTQNVRLYVAESAVYEPMPRYLRGIVSSGRHIGELTHASTAAGFRAPDYGYAGRREWLSTPAMGGTGTWMLHGIHRVAALRYVLGEVTTVYMGDHHAASFTRPNLEATMSGLYTLESGVHVSVLQTCETRLRGDLAGYTLYGDRGVVRATERGCVVMAADQETGASTTVPYPEQALSSYALEIEAFADYVSGERTGPTTAASERRSLAIVQAGYESARSGQPVDLRQRFGEL